MAYIEPKTDKIIAYMKKFDQYTVTTFTGQFVVYKLFKDINAYYKIINIDYKIRVCDFERFIMERLIAYEKEYNIGSAEIGYIIETSRNYVDDMLGLAF